MAEVIRNPDMKDSPGAAESRALAGYSRVLVHNSHLGVSIPEVDR